MGVLAGQASEGNEVSDEFLEDIGWQCGFQKRKPHESRFLPVPPSNWTDVTPLAVKFMFGAVDVHPGKLCICT